MCARLCREQVDRGRRKQRARKARIGLRIKRCLFTHVQGFTASKADRDRRKQRAKNERQRAARKAEVEKQREEEQLLAVAAQVRIAFVVVSSQVSWERKGWNGLCQGVCNARRAERGMKTHLSISGWDILRHLR